MSAQPVTAIITWAAQGGPAVPSDHRYRATVNLPGGGTKEDVGIDRPGVEEAWPDQLVEPLPPGARIHGVMIGRHFQWQYAERPVIGTCEELPGAALATLQATVEALVGTAAQPSERPAP